MLLLWTRGIFCAILWEFSCICLSSHHLARLTCPPPLFLTICPHLLLQESILSSPHHASGVGLTNSPGRLSYMPLSLIYALPSMEYAFLRTLITSIIMFGGGGNCLIAVYVC